jgi:hypothetical protein
MRVHYLKNGTKYVGFTDDSTEMQSCSYITIADDSAEAITIKVGGTPVIVGDALNKVIPVTVDNSLNELKHKLSIAVTFSEQKDLLAELYLIQLGIGKGST